MSVVTVSVDGSSKSVTVGIAAPTGKAPVFAGSAPLNTPIPTSPVLDPNSAALVAGLQGKGVNALLHEYGGTVYEATASDPLVKIVCKEHWTHFFEGTMRMPKGAKPVGGSDGSMIVLDTTTGLGVDFWQVQETSPGVYTTTFCSQWSYAGAMPGYGASGWGQPLIAGMPRVWEMEQGHIDHALTFASCQAAKLAGELGRYPAGKSDGPLSYPPGILEGSRLQLSPAADLSKCNAGELIIAKAAQVYGMYCNNTTAPGIGIGFEDAGPVVAGNPYHDLGLSSDYWKMPNIPWGQLRVLAKWDGL